MPTRIESVIKQITDLSLASLGEVIDRETRRTTQSEPDTISVLWARFMREAKVRPLVDKLFRQASAPLAPSSEGVFKVYTHIFSNSYVRSIESSTGPLAPLSFNEYHFIGAYWPEETVRFVNDKLEGADHTLLLPIIYSLEGANTEGSKTLLRQIQADALARSGENDFGDTLILLASGVALYKMTGEFDDNLWGIFDQNILERKEGQHIQKEFVEAVIKHGDTDKFIKILELEFKVIERVYQTVLVALLKGRSDEEAVKTLRDFFDALAKQGMKRGIDRVLDQAIVFVLKKFLDYGDSGKSVLANLVKDLLGDTLPSQRNLLQRIIDRFLRDHVAWILTPEMVDAKVKEMKLKPDRIAKSDLYHLMDYYNVLADENKKWLLGQLFDQAKKAKSLLAHDAKKIYPFLFDHVDEPQRGQLVAEVLGEYGELLTRPNASVERVEAFRNLIARVGGDAVLGFVSEQLDSNNYLEAQVLLHEGVKLKTPTIVAYVVKNPDLLLYLIQFEPAGDFIKALTESNIRLEDIYEIILAGIISDYQDRESINGDVMTQEDMDYAIEHWSSQLEDGSLNPSFVDYVLGKSSQETNTALNNVEASIQAINLQKGAGFDAGVVARQLFEFADEEASPASRAALLGVIHLYSQYYGDAVAVFKSLREGAKKLLGEQPILTDQAWLPDNVAMHLGLSHTGYAHQINAGSVDRTTGLNRLMVLLEGSQDSRSFIEPEDAILSGAAHVLRSLGITAKLNDADIQVIKSDGIKHGTYKFTVMDTVGKEAIAHVHNQTGALELIAGDSTLNPIGDNLGMAWVSTQMAATAGIHVAPFTLAAGPRSMIGS